MVSPFFVILAELTKIPDKIMHIDDFITFFARHSTYVSKTPGKILNLKGQCHKILNLRFFSLNSSFGPTEWYLV